MCFWFGQNLGVRMTFSDDILGRGAGSWWRFLGTNVIAIAGYILGLVVFGGIMGALMNAGLFPSDIWYDFASGTADTLAGFLLLFGSVAFLHPFLALGLWVCYKRPYTTLANPLRLPWKTQAVYGALLIVASGLVVELIMLVVPGWDVSSEVIWQPGLWFIWIIPTLLIVLLQCAAEEYFFRGFLQQYLARLTGVRAIYYGVPAGAWALLHLGNFEQAWVAWGFVAATFVMGLIFADWADRSRLLAGPIAAHFANNVIATCVVGNSLESDVMNIWETDLTRVSDAMIAVYSLVAMVVLCVIYIALRPRILRQSPVV